MTLRQVLYFIAVAENGSITAAAHQVNISQSVITQAIHALERELGAALFERHARGVALTHDGHRFLRHAHRIVAAVTDARRALSARPASVTGHLNLGVTSMVAGYYLADLLARFRRSSPRVKVMVTEDERSYLEHLLVNGELDIAVMLVSSLEDQAALEQALLVRSPFRLWLPPNHALLARDRIRLADIAAEPLVLLTADDLETATRALWRNAPTRPNVVLRTSSVEAVRSLVATGAGLSVLPDMAFRPWSLEGDRLEARAVADIDETVDVGLVWRRGSPLPPVAAEFLEIALEHG